MKVDAHKLGLAGCITNAVFFTGCSVLMQFWPERTLQISAAVFHMSSFGPLLPYFDLSSQVFISGLIQSAVYAYIYFYILGYAITRIHRH